MYSKTKLISTNNLKLLVIFSIILLGTSCRKENIINEFNIDFSNIEKTALCEEKGNNGDTLSMFMDLNNSITQGIIIPSNNQSNDGLFHFKASVNKGEEKLFYKIYYQNESYKYEENLKFANENFYGSWEDTDIEFKEVPSSGEIKDAFRILGNPRNEKQYFGSKPRTNVTEQEILKGVESIKKDIKWYNAIKEKAKVNKNSVETQLYLDMCWIINYNTQVGETNNRWKRNPRTGKYSFILVVVTQEALNQLPKGVKNISVSDSINGFINPYQYFKYGKGNKLKGVSYTIAKQNLNLRAVISPERGVFVDILKYPLNDFKIFPNNGKVGNDDSLFNNALYEQFFHSISKHFKLKNLPVVEDILDDSYTVEKYRANEKKYSDLKTRIIDFPYISDYPGKTVRVDDKGRYISLINPGNENRMNKPRKESVGISTRVGFTYGKFRGKIKFPAQLNSSGVWSGLTNAFWLIYQSDFDWNKRRICPDKGYVKAGQGVGEDAGRSPNTNYSEIDIEIIKTSKYWPDQEHKEKNYNPYNKNECVLACTNWDLACQTPKDYFKQGIHKYKYNNQDFSYHRWSEAYRALTIRSAIENNIFKNDFYFFEIEWKPNEIIWRIGASPDKMYVVGYMSDKFTSIPNNQMVGVVTQEYHYSEFWPPVIFDQNLLPYPKKDIEGRVYDIVVE